MTAAAPNRSVPPPRRRRRWPAVVAGVVLLLVGRGLGWFGGGGAAVPGGRANPPRVAPGPSAASAVVAPMPPVAPAIVAATLPAAPAGEAGPTRRAPGQDAAGHDAAPAPSATAEVATGTVAVTTGAAATPGAVTPMPPGPDAAATGPAPVGAAAMSADRFASQLSLVSFEAREGRLGSALVALEALRQAPLDEAQRVAAAAAAQQLDAALASRCGSIVQALARGTAVVARDELAALLADGEAVLAPWLAQAMELAGVSTATALVGPLAVAATAPIARPLPRGREVRWRAGTEWRQGRVADARTDQVTVRVETSSGVAFPTVLVVQCEPIGATAAEAVEMGLAAVQRGEALLARAWLAVAHCRGLPADEPRGQQLAALLPPAR